MRLWRPVTKIGLLWHNNSIFYNKTVYTSGFHYHVIIYGFIWPPEWQIFKGPMISSFVFIPYVLYRNEYTGIQELSLQCSPKGGSDTSKICCLELEKNSVQLFFLHCFVGTTCIQVFKMKFNALPSFCNEWCSYPYICVFLFTCLLRVNK
jgi:hypothetical protein